MQETTYFFLDVCIIFIYNDLYRFKLNHSRDASECHVQQKEHRQICQPESGIEAFSTRYLTFVTILS